MALGLCLRVLFGVWFYVLFVVFVRLPFLCVCVRVYVCTCYFWTEMFLSTIAFYTMFSCNKHVTVTASEGIQ